jgi:phage terminase large subunit-like protein
MDNIAHQNTDSGFTSADELVALSTDALVAELESWSQERLIAEISRWQFWARVEQLPPSGSWRLWLVLAGRGFGKTRMGAEWVRAQAMANKEARIALVGASLSEAREIMVEGESGLLSLPGAKGVIWQPSLRRVTWPNGAMATLYSAARPDSLRGPQHDFAWADEIAKWNNGIATWDNLMFGLRLGQSPRVVATSTPKSVALVRRLVAEAELDNGDVALSKGRTSDNSAHLPDSFLAAMNLAYAGTRIGRQELDGEMIDDVAGALWSRALIERCRVTFPPEMRRVVVGVDPPAGTINGDHHGSNGGDACGIIVAGLGVDDKAYVLADHSVMASSPERWANAVADAAALWSADRVIAEANQGGQMVASVLRAASVNMPVRLVHASRGKVARAEPVVALYESGRAFHVGGFAALEDELCGLVSGGGYEGPGRSPDRADACVWALWSLMLGSGSGEVRVRAV